MLYSICFLSRVYNQTWLLYELVYFLLLLLLCTCQFYSFAFNNLITSLVYSTVLYHLLICFGRQHVYWIIVLLLLYVYCPKYGLIIMYQ